MFPFSLFHLMQILCVLLIFTVRTQNRIFHFLFLKIFFPFGIWSSFVMLWCWMDGFVHLSLVTPHLVLLKQYITNAPYKTHTYSCAYLWNNSFRRWNIDKLQGFSWRVIRRVTNPQVAVLEGLALQLGSVISGTSTLLRHITIKYCHRFGCNSQSDWKKHLKNWK